ncbi:MAG: 30S ribosomal protein S17e [Candidatus Bathyarchaeota archaeon]
MGKVRPDHVKRTAHELVDQFPDKFTKDFENNKEMVDALTNVSSRKLRNRVAGYITNLIKSNQSEGKN